MLPSGNLNVLLAGKPIDLGTEAPPLTKGLTNPIIALPRLID